MKTTTALHRAVSIVPDNPATIMGQRTRTWMELQDRVARLAAALQQLGVKPGDRVAALALNSDRYLEYLFAVWWAGGAVVPMNVRWSPQENVYSLNDSGAEILFIDRNFLPSLSEIKARADGLKHVIYMADEPADGLYDYEKLIQETTPVSDACGEGNDIAGIYYTGGTTGFPKGVVLSQRSIWFNGMVCAKEFGIEAEDRYLHVAPMFHLADGGAGNAVSTVGGTHIFLEAFEPKAALQAFATYKPTITLMVPTMIGMVLADDDFDPAKMASIKSMIYGASPMPEGLLTDLIQKLPHIGLFQGYGQTELGPIATVMPKANHVFDGAGAGKLRSAGRPAVGVVVRIADEEGNTLPANRVGEVVVSSPGAMTEYWQRPEETAATLKDGEIYTGDGAYMDEDGFVFIVDRLKDMIVTGGENVFSAEVESVLSKHPAVAESVVVGIPSEKWGEAVHAILILKPGEEVSEAEVIAFCKSHIANYKVPRSIEFRTDPFPLSGAGKILKKDLRSPYWEGTERGVS